MNESSPGPVPEGGSDKKKSPFAAFYAAVEAGKLPELNAELERQQRELKEAELASATSEPVPAIKPARHKDTSEPRYTGNRTARAGSATEAAEDATRERYLRKTGTHD